MLTKGSISHYFFLLSAGLETMILPPYRCSYLLMLRISEFILLVGFTEETIFESTAVGRWSGWPNMQGTAGSEVQGGNYVGK